MSGPGKFVALLVLAAGTGCKLSETITAPYGDPFIVIHSILEPNQPRLSVIVEEAREGTQRRVNGAAVRLTVLDTAGCSSPSAELDNFPSTLPGGGFYFTNGLCPLQPGTRVALRVQTLEGALVTGVTRVPGITAIDVAGGAQDSASPFGIAGSMVLDRTRDSIRINANAPFARGLQVEVVRQDQGGFLTFRTITDTMALTIPGNLVDPFEGDGRTAFRAGAYYLLAIAVTDTNYFDFVRSGTNPLTGRGFINHLTGGVGVFGSLLIQRYRLKVVAPQTDPREGVYRIAGNLFGTDVDLTWNVYRDALAENGDGFSGFVDGTWTGGLIQTSANLTILAAAVPVQPGASPANFFGTILGAAQVSSVPGQVGDQFELTGNRVAKGEPFSLEVSAFLNGRNQTDTVTAVQVSGP